MSVVGTTRAACPHLGDSDAGTIGKAPPVRHVAMGDRCSRRCPPRCYRPMTTQANECAPEVRVTPSSPAHTRHHDRGTRRSSRRAGDVRLLRRGHRILGRCPAAACRPTGRAGDVVAVLSSPRSSTSLERPCPSTAGRCGADCPAAGPLRTARRRAVPRPPLGPAGPPLSGPRASGRRMTPRRGLRRRRR